MAVYEYSYTTLDPHSGQMRTFRITTDSRNVALTEIRRTVLAINRKRLDQGNTRVLAKPDAKNLEANQPARVSAPSLRVAMYA